MYKVGDIVRVIPPSYLDLTKCNFHQRHALEEANPATNQAVMLGGRYTVKAVHASRQGNRLELIEGKTGDYLLEMLVVLDKDVANCPYAVGDKVVFRPKCSDYELGFLRSTLLSDRDKVHEIKDILNEYYIFVDYDKENSNSYPMRWVDFERA